MTKKTTIDGFICNKTDMGTAMIDVRFTSDSMGESISLAIGESIMLQVPYEPVERLIKKTRGKKRAKSR